MSMKEYLKDTVQSFFIVVTLINIAMIVLGRLFYPTQQMGYHVFCYPVLYGFCSMIPTLIMYSAKELTVRQLLVRKVVQMILITVLLVLLIFGFDGICTGNAKSIVGVSVSIIVIYVLEEIISWFVNTRNAENLTKSLHKYQKMQQNGQHDAG